MFFLNTILYMRHEECITCSELGNHTKVSARDCASPFSSLSLEVADATSRVPSALTGKGSMLFTWLEVGKMFSSSSTSRQDVLLARDSTMRSLNLPVSNALLAWSGCSTT